MSLPQDLKQAYKTDHKHAHTKDPKRAYTGDRDRAKDMSKVRNAPATHTQAHTHPRSTRACKGMHMHTHMDATAHAQTLVHTHTPTDRMGERHARGGVAMREAEGAIPETRLEHRRTAVPFLLR